MKYAMLIFSNETEDAKMTPEEQQADMEAYFAITEEWNKSGVCVGGEALMPTNMATSVRVKDGKTLTTDGPFAETKEQLGGFYLMECKDLDEAIRYAAQIPAATHGTIEVRPLMEFDNQ